MATQRTRADSRGGRRITRLAAALLCSLALPAYAQQALTVEQLQQRLEALERRLGGSVATEAGGDASLADLDQRLRIIERRLELQQEEAVAKAQKLAEAA